MVEAHKTLQTHNKIAKGPLRVDMCWKKQTHTHIKSAGCKAQLLIILPCNRTFCTSTANDIACMLKGLKEQYCAVPILPFTRL